MTMQQQTYGTGDVARMAGVSLRQLQWWDERKVVSPSKRCGDRVYRSQEVVVVAVVAELRRKGFSLQKVRHVLAFLHKEMYTRLGAAVANDRDLHVLTNGKDIYLEDEPERILCLLANARKPLSVVSISVSYLRQFGYSKPS